MVREAIVMTLIVSVAGARRGHGGGAGRRPAAGRDADSRADVVVRSQAVAALAVVTVEHAVGRVANDRVFPRSGRKYSLFAVSKQRSSRDARDNSARSISAASIDSNIAASHPVWTGSPNYSSTHLVLFTLVLAEGRRISYYRAHSFAALAVPKNVLAIMAFALALLVAPTQIDITAAAPATSIDWVLSLAVELLAGLALGLGTAILVAGAQLAGQLIAQLSGLSLAEVFDPNLGAEVPLFAQLLGLFTVAVYLLIGGHRWLLAGLLDSFRALPVGGGHLPLALPQRLSR